MRPAVLVVARQSMTLLGLAQALLTGSPIRLNDLYARIQERFRVTRRKELRITADPVGSKIELVFCVGTMELRAGI